MEEFGGGHEAFSRLNEGRNMKTEVTIGKLKEFLGALEKRNIKYVVIAGFGVDGKRGHQTRPHQDLDVLCLKEDLPKIEEVVQSLGYSGTRYNDLYKLKREDGSKVDLALVTEEGDEAVTYGRIAITRFPKKLFENPQIGRLKNFEYDIAPNELLRTWGEHAPKGDDADYVKTLPVNPDVIKKIKRLLRDNNQ